jgi:Protein of unknown function (DUF2501)
MRHLPIAIITLAALGASPAHAQLMDQLKGAVGGGQTNGGGSMLGGLGGGALPSVGQASPSNTAGVLQYCIQNKYVGGGGASSVKDSLMSKMTGSPQQDSGYRQGSSGLLQTGNGQSYSLGGGGIKDQITQKLCDQVLQHAKSLL